jgi:hypothetical protein
MGQSLRHIRQMLGEPSVPQITIIRAKLPFHVALVFFQFQKVGFKWFSVPCKTVGSNFRPFCCFQCPAKQWEVTVDLFVFSALSNSW